MLFVERKPATKPCPVGDIFVDILLVALVN